MLLGLEEKGLVQCGNTSLTGIGQTLHATVRGMER